MNKMLTSLVNQCFQQIKSYTFLWKEDMIVEAFSERGLNFVAEVTSSYESMTSYRYESMTCKNAVGITNRFQLD